MLVEVTSSWAGEVSSLTHRRRGMQASTLIYSSDATSCYSRRRFQYELVRAGLSHATPGSSYKKTYAVTTATGAISSACERIRDLQRVHDGGKGAWKTETRPCEIASVLVGPCFLAQGVDDQEHVGTSFYSGRNWQSLR
jgi:hypothetical protein